MPSSPDVSVLIPAYKHDHLAETICSALEQTYGFRELLISDDCPGDEVEETVRPYLSDGRVRYFRNRPGLGLVGNHLRLARLASAPWLKFLDDDDLLEPHAVGSLAEAVASQPSAAIAFGDLGYIGGAGGQRSQREALPELVPGDVYLLGHYARVPLTYSTRTLVRREVLLHAAELGPPARMISFEEMVGLLACLVGDVVHLPQVLCHHRLHAGNFSRSTEVQVLCDDLQYILLPYAFGLRQGRIPAPRLRAWRDRMLKKATRGTITRLLAERDYGGVYRFVRHVFGLSPAVCTRSLCSPRLFIKAIKGFTGARLRRRW